MSPREQRLAALTQANIVRAAASAYKRDMRNGRCSVVDALSDPRVAHVPLLTLLTAAPKVGPTKAAKVLHRAMVSGLLRAGELTSRQRAAVVEEIRLQLPCVRFTA